MSDTPFHLDADRGSRMMWLAANQPAPGMPWERPKYDPGFEPAHRMARHCAMLAVHCFRNHMTDEGHQLQEGLASAGYELHGAGYPDSETDAIKIASDYSLFTLFIQDKREWDPARGGCFDKSAEFKSVAELAGVKRIFRVTVHKDLLFTRKFIYDFHKELWPHAIVHYYHPDVVRILSPWLVNTPLIRTYHSLDPAHITHFVPGDQRKTALLSGALNREVYPLRERLMLACRLGYLPEVDLLPHPGYHARGTCTPAYLETLGRYKVAICTSSIMGFALRKLIEATACGCRVITDLPEGDVLPEIDANLIRIPHNSSPGAVRECVAEAARTWDPRLQLEFAERAINFYDYRRVYGKLADDIEACRQGYNNAK